jgi:hypothetical protein
LIRSEFRGWWMGAIRIPLCAIDRYLTDFFPSRPSDPLALKRFPSYFNPSGSLRIFIRKEELVNRDICRLIKHKKRFPNFTIRFEYLTDVTSSKAKGLEELVNNQHPAWLRWVRINAISQIRTWPLNYNARVTIVLKDKHAALWMRPMMEAARSIPDDFLASMGLDAISDWKMDFGVDYT